MGQIIFKIWYMVAVLPFLIFMDGWARFKPWMDKNKYWGRVPYILLVLLVILLIILLLDGYRW